MAARSFNLNDPVQWAALRGAVGRNDLEAASKMVDTFKTNSQMFISSAASYKNNPNSVDKIDFSAVDESWKDTAIEFYNTVPEAAQVIDTTAKSIALCNLRIGFQDFKGDLVPVDDDHELSQILRNLQGPSGDYHSILHTAAVNYQVTGDGFLIGEPVYDDSGTRVMDYENWEFVSVKELAVDINSKQIYRDPVGGNKKYNYSNLTEMGRIVLDEHYYIARGWRRSPWHSQLSDSALRKNLTILKLLRKMEDLTNAIANSQLSAGILLVPDELSFGPANETAGGTDETDDDIDPLTLQLIEYLSLPVQDRSSSASLAPLVFRGKSEFLKEVRLERLGRDMDSQTREIRAELLDRLAMGMDAPKEIMMGKSSTSSWTGSNIDSQFATSHVIPLGQLLADFLTRAYLWPMLRKAIRDQKSLKSEDDIKRYRILFDPANIVARVDKATLALRAYEKGMMSESAALRALGFNDSDARNANERRQDLILKLISASPVTLAPCLVPLIDGLEHIVDCLPVAEGGTGLRNKTTPVLEEAPDLNTPENPSAQKEKKTPERGPHLNPPDSGQDAEKYPGGKDEDRRNPNNSRLQDNEAWPNLILQITSLAHGLRTRAIEKTANKIFSASQGDPELSKAVKGLTNVEAVVKVAKGRFDMSATMPDTIEANYDEASANVDFVEIISSWMIEQTNVDSTDIDIAAEMGAAAVSTALKSFVGSMVGEEPTRFDNSLFVPSELADTILNEVFEFLILDD